MAALKTLTEPGTAAARGGPLAGGAVVAIGSMTGPLAALSRKETNELIERVGVRAEGAGSLLSCAPCEPLALAIRQLRLGHR
ncbi:hypothetical protein GCM10010270_76900 [Streptomyces violaceus]|nr:hypothetical protein GCM10010270_76900 [Streptomyces janthinus]